MESKKNKTKSKKVQNVEEKKSTAKKESSTKKVKENNKVAKETNEVIKKTPQKEVKTETIKEVKPVQEKQQKEKKNTEIIKTVIVLGLLGVLVSLTFVIGLTKQKDKLLYQTHVGIKDTTVAEYLDIIKKNDTSIIYIGRPGCGYCQMFVPILTEVLEQYKIGVEYINIENIASEEEWNAFMNSNEFLSSGEWGTPTLLVYKNGEIINKNPGYVEKNTLIKFLTDSNLIKGE